MAQTQPEAPLSKHEPIFIETLAAAAKCTPAEAVTHLREVADMTDYHRVETYLEYFAA